MAKTKDSDWVHHIAQDDKLVLKQDLDIPANQDKLVVLVKYRYGRPYSGCALLLQKSTKSRRILKAGELIFSGQNEGKYDHADYGTYYVFSAGVSNSEACHAFSNLDKFDKFSLT